MFHFLKRKKLTGVTELAIVGLITIFGLSLIDTIWAVYLDSLINNASLVGFISAGLTIVAIVTDLFLTPLFQTRKSTTLFFISLCVHAVIYCCFAINKSVWIFIVLAIIVTIGKELYDEAFELLLRKESKQSNIAQNEGFIFSVENVGWLVGPLLSGAIASIFNVSIVFVLASVFLVISAITFKFYNLHEKHVEVKHVDNNILKNIVDFLKNKELVKGFIVGMGLFYWWAMMYIFVPLYMLEKNLPPYLIGIFLFAIVIPLIALEYQVGKLTDKSSFKMMFTVALLIVSSCAVLAFFSTNVYLTLLFLILASFGMAIIEPNIYSYFFKVVKTEKQQAKYFGTYQISYVGNFIGKALAATVLLFLSFEYVFLTAGIFMFLLIFVARTMKV
ncbi:MAG: MFS transporter [Candidatus Woesearchaeota archaeon]|jgi:MFS family permease